MLVIQFRLLRVHAIEIFRRLHQHGNILRPFRAKDLRDGTEPDTDTEFREFLSKSCNEHFVALFPMARPPKTPSASINMIERFKEDTEPTSRTRNDARAHRFGNRAKDSQVSFQTLEKVAEQVEVFKTYVRNVFLVLTGGNHTMDSVIQWDWQTTARDMADLIVLGNIEEVIALYGFVGEHDDNRLRYWNRRKQFYDSGGKLVEPYRRGS